MVAKGLYFPFASYGYFSLQEQPHRQHLSCDISYAGYAMARVAPDQHVVARNRNPHGLEPRGPKSSDDTVTFQEIISRSVSEFHLVMYSSKVRLLINTHIGEGGGRREHKACSVESRSLSANSVGT